MRPARSTISCDLIDYAWQVSLPGAPIVFAITNLRGMSELWLGAVGVKIRILGSDRVGWSRQSDKLGYVAVVTAVTNLSRGSGIDAVRVDHPYVARLIHSNAARLTQCRVSGASYITEAGG